jgi:hypothetical protein
MLMNLKRPHPPPQEAHMFNRGRNAEAFICQADEVVFGLGMEVVKTVTFFLSIQRLNVKR